MWRTDCFALSTTCASLHSRVTAHVAEPSAPATMLRSFMKQWKKCAVVSRSIFTFSSASMRSRTSVMSWNTHTHSSSLARSPSSSVTFTGIRRPLLPLVITSLKRTRGESTVPPRPRALARLVARARAAARASCCPRYAAYWLASSVSNSARTFCPTRSAEAYPNSSHAAVFTARMRSSRASVTTTASCTLPLMLSSVRRSASARRPAAAIARPRLAW